jgi:hypothetical protein
VRGAIGEDKAARLPKVKPFYGLFTLTNRRTLKVPCDIIVLVISSMAPTEAIIARVAPTPRCR